MIRCAQDDIASAHSLEGKLREGSRSIDTEILAECPPDTRAQAFSRAMHASRAALRMTLPILAVKAHHHVHTHMYDGMVSCYRLVVSDIFCCHPSAGPYGSGFSWTSCSMAASSVWTLRRRMPIKAR